MHWEKSPPSLVANSRPYQGVRVRDPVKELLRRKRGLEPPPAKTSPSAADVVPYNNQSSYPQGSFGFELASSASTDSLATAGDGGAHYAGWRTQPTATFAGLQPTATSWSSSEYNHQDPSTQTLAYPAPTTLTADMYMQTLCSSYTVVRPPTMLTYSHTPLVTNLGTIPMAPAPASLPQMDLQDSGLTYIPWAQPLTTISTMPSTGVQFTPGSAALPGSPLVHMPLPMPLTTMISQLDTQGLDAQAQPIQLPQPSDHQMNSKTPTLDMAPQPLVKDPDVQPESPNPLEKLLEDPKEEDEEEDKNNYSNSLFLRDV
ncbi:POU domain class 2-associating factor 1 [Lampris incognitus]|uniref:POU domain class 2-associating factor 1 n=1 Tax=Lampris incognitus TaxID=2546036 RepID=UPI0024B4A8E3|nr:POU domain class 2-associating factor 1 [Lampris incognitus]